MIDDRERTQVSLYLTADAIPVLREASVEMKLTTNPNGSASAIIQHLVDRLGQDATPFETTNKGEVFQDLLMIAGVIKEDLNGGEEETVAVMRIASQRIYDGLAPHIIDNAIADIRVILF